jgi:hypothetical protein
MLIDTSLTIAYKCPSCGSFEFFSVSLFEMYSRSESIFNCHCLNSSITVRADAERGIFIKLPCIGCEDDHTFLFSKKDLLTKDLNTFCCPESGFKLCFIGKDEPVRKAIDNTEEELDELMDMFGYDSYFRNTQVMFDSLNKIHDIAEQGNLYCECGSTEIELVLLSDRILLKCGKCCTGNMIKAATNEDLKALKKRQSIIICQENPHFFDKRPYTIIKD